MTRGTCLGICLSVMALAACGSTQQGGASGPLPKGVSWAVDAGGAVLSRPTVVGDGLVVGSSSGKVQMVGRKDGALKWSYDARKDDPAAEFHHEALAAGDLIVTATAGKGGGRVYAFDAASGQVRWKQPLGADPNGVAGADTQVVQRADRVFAVGLDGKLVCLDLKTGAKSWEAGPVEPLITPAAGPSYIYVASNQTKVQAFDPDSGKPVWEAELMAVVTTSLIVHGDVVYAGTSPFRMFRLDGKTGEILAKVALQGKPVHDPAATDTSVSVFLRDAHGAVDAESIISLDAGLGRILWGRKAPEEWTSLHPRIWRDTILAGDRTGELFAYGLQDGAKKWSVMLGQEVGAIGSSDDMLYVGTLKGSVYALAPPSGSGS